MVLCIESMDLVPPILTKITSTYLECTLHSAKYHGLIRLRSNHIVCSGENCNASAAPPNENGNNAAERMAMPDISSLSVVPICPKRAAPSISGNGQKCGRTRSKEVVNIRLLPKLFNTTHTEDRSDGDANEEVSDDGINCIGNNHPLHDLVRITRDLEVNLKERLKDASDGAVRGDGGRYIEPTHPSGIQEEFLLRSEAIVSELLSAVQQQLRKERTHRSGNDGGRPSKKHKATEQAIASNTSTHPPLKYYSALARQLNVLQSMDNVTDISLHKDPSTNTNNDNNNENTPADLTHLSVTCLDRNKRSHTWHAELYPSIVLTVDLPSEFALEDNLQLEKWWEDGADVPDSQGEDALGGGLSSSALPRIHHSVERALERHQPLFDELDDLDSHLWILEPGLPARSGVERRIALWEGGASVAIALDPESPRGAPAMVRFLGATAATMAAAAKVGAGGTAGGAVVDWRTSFAKFVSEEEGRARTTKEDDNALPKSKRWSEGRSVRENLELWFGSPLPSPLSPEAERSDFLVECGICYAHRFPVEDACAEEGPLPEARCANPSCNRHYHESCLFEWLHSLPTARVSFDRIFGSCPYCCETVSVRIMNR